MVFASLPAEIISQIITYLDTPSDVAHLAQTCRKLHEHSQAEGWKSFVRANFHAVAPSARWMDAAHTLSTLTRNLDQLSLLARPVYPPHVKVTGNGLPTPQSTSRQTIGYQPMIDAYEELVGSSWHHRYETLVWSTGASLVARLTKKGPFTRSRRKPESRPDSKAWSKVPGADVWTICCRDDDLFEGRDDITALKLVRPYSRYPADPWSLSVILGRASGMLERIHLGNAGNAFDTFDTASLPVRAIDISPSKTPLLAACLGRSRLRVYDAAKKGIMIGHSTEINISTDVQESKSIHCTQFLSDTTVAIGKGLGSEIVSVYTLRPSGLEKTSSFQSGTNPDGCHATSTYALSKLRWSSDEASCDSNVFLSGSFDGRVRLHDLRTPNPFESLYYNRIDRSAVYSLQALDRYRFAAGASAYRLLNIFDLRVSGMPQLSTQMSAMTISSSKTKRPPAHAHVFLTQPKGAGRDYPNRKFSPVYSLASPSPASTSLYVGTEGLVTQLDLTDVADKHPDPSATRFAQTSRTQNRNGKPRGIYNEEILNLGMYDGDFDNQVRLKMQRDIGIRGQAIPGYDQRWEAVTRSTRT